MDFDEYVQELCTWMQKKTQQEEGQTPANYDDSDGDVLVWCTILDPIHLNYKEMIQKIVGGDQVQQQIGTATLVGLD